VPGVQFRYKVGPGVGQAVAAADVEDDPAAWFGSTGMQTVAVPPAPDGVTGTSESRNSSVVCGVPPIACCSWDESSRRP